MPGKMKPLALKAAVAAAIVAGGSAVGALFAAPVVSVARTDSGPAADGGGSVPSAVTQAQTPAEPDGSSEERAERRDGDEECDHAGGRPGPRGRGAPDGQTSA